jgi:formamidopyrimidine-DNA glycosylase
MPELAEVEAYRKLWDCGRGQRILDVQLHPFVRVFRTPNASAVRTLVGCTLLDSEARGKLMLFCFSRHRWLAIHLGMSGQLRVEKPDFMPDKHDHLVLFQRKRALVFTDPRQFGAVRFHVGRESPDWWRSLPPAISSRQFTLDVMADFLHRHPRLPIKGALLLQSGFPGVGNWMADEILWQARLNPRRIPGKLRRRDLQVLWKSTRAVCRTALRRIAEHDDKPPSGWLFHQRWSAEGKCPRDDSPLKRRTIAGRTTAWCPKCQG